MDVTCERCGTEYEFDETLVSDRGTTVKCTQCGHLFKVFRPGGASEGAPEAMWRVRRRDGSVETVPTLRDLQRRIIQGVLNPEDEISASGQPWKPLGAIAELESFFAPAVGARVPSSSAGRQDATVPFEVQRPAGDPPPPPRATPPRQKRTLIGVGEGPPPIPAEAAATVVAQTRASSPPPRSPSNPAPAPRPASVPPGARTSERPPAARQSSFPPRERRAAAEHEAPALRVSAADAVPPRRRGGAGIFVALGLLSLGVVAAAVWQRERIMGFFGAPEDQIASFLALGSEALARDDEESYQAAVFELTRATGIDARDARALSALAHAHALWAQALAFEALDHDARAGSDPASAGEARRARSEMSRHVAAARRFAEDAVRSDPSLAVASLVLADCLRLGGDFAAAEQHLARARRGSDVPADELHRVEALLAAARAEGNLALAEREARLAVEAAPRLVRNRVLLARALLASGDAEGARRQLAEAGLDHEMVRPLIAAMDAAGPPSNAEAALEPAPEAPEAAAAEPTATAAAPGGAVPPGRDYAFYVEQGEALLARGDIPGARAHFEQALAVRAGGEALAGLGQVALRSGSTSTAVSRFRQATQKGYVEAYFGLGETYRRTGETADAVLAYERYLERAPRGPHASMARRRIDELGRAHTDGPGASEQAGAPGGGAAEPPPSAEPAPTAPPPTPEPAPAPEASPPSPAPAPPEAPEAPAP